MFLHRHKVPNRSKTSPTKCSDTSQKQVKNLPIYNFSNYMQQHQQKASQKPTNLQVLQLYVAAPAEKQLKNRALIFFPPSSKP